MKKTILRKYAKLAVRKGVNLKKGQGCAIYAQVEQHEFAEMVAEEAYRAGAKWVQVFWQDQAVRKLDLRHQTVTQLSRVEEWEKVQQQMFVDQLPARIHISSEDPDGLKGVSVPKMQKAQAARSTVLRPYRKAIDNKHQWTIIAVPSKKWAKKVFPELPKGRAVERLWEAILSCSRALEGDPLENWRLHDLDIKARAEALNAMGLTALEYRDPNGTELRVGLIPEALFLGGAERCPVNGVEYNPNIPSEELFVTPRAGDAEGVVHATRPLAVQGVLIEDFWLRFEGGRVVELHAEKNEDALRTLVGMDEGAAMLGECALVPYESPIRESGILFYNTLFDENAACHLALGRGYSSNIRDYEKYSLDELRAMGVNDSMVHEDFMIGSAELDITGLTASGERLPIFRSGGWAF